MRPLNKLVAPHLLELEPYSSARSEFKGKASVFLDANENPIRSRYNRYPDPLQKKLKERIATLKHCESQQLFLGNGSDEAIDLLLRIFCQAGKDAILTLPPTYGMYKVSAAINQVQNIEIPLDEDFQPNVAAILAAQTPQTKLLFLCSPNNPTANDMKLSAIQQLIEGFEGIVVVDEAYIDFSEQPSCLNWVGKYPNLVVLQTFSKAWGMAGIRLGMAFASKAIIDWFNKVKPPYNVNQLTQEFAYKQLADADVVQADIFSLLKERKRLIEALRKLSFVQKVFPTAANFILVRVDAPNDLYQYLVQEGIIVRNRSNLPACEGCLRFTVGNALENNRLLEALKVF